MSTQDDRQLGVVDHMAAGPVSGSGFLTGPGLFEHPVRYAVVDGRAIHDGCIDMGPVDEVEAQAAEVAARREARLTTAFAGSEDGDARLTVTPFGIGLPSDSAFLWPAGQVAYAIDAGLPNQQRVTDAIAHLQQNTGIRFTLRTAANAGSLPNWIQVVSNGAATSSSSAIGMRGGRQDLRLADAHPWPILVHEFLHALGVYHEQSRSDRDSFVEIKWDNIQDGPPPEGENDTRHNFQTKPGSTDYFGYDYGSLMHYHATAFAKDTSKPTIVPRQSGVTIGQRNGMSPGDRQTVAKMYERFFEKGYSGVWRAGSGRYALWVNDTWDGFAAKWQQWSADGLRLVDVHVRPVRDGARYSGVFLPGSGGHALWANASWKSFQAKWDEWSRQGLRLIDIHVANVGGQDRYTGAFLAGSGGHALWVGASWDSFRAQWEQWSTQGLRLHDLHVHQVAGQDRYTGVFLPGGGGHALWVNASWASFVAKWQEWGGQGLRLVDLNQHRVGNEIRFSGAFLPGQDGYALWANVTWESFRAKWEELAGQGLRLVDFEQVNPASGALLDGADDLPAGDEIPAAFGGIVSAGVSVAAEDAMAADGQGAAELDGPVRTSHEDTGSGGAELPNVVMPRTAADDHGGALTGAENGAPVSAGAGAGGMVRDDG
ncbi:M12 family metallopeptidase [Blastococcus haudaquaticus]|uniref:Astacin (Peptidase family M12A) n=1 Tax=Blastococcus haudaquaticus TaxID=1938745 RepID=A0A286GQS0_9ACTN|nr:M12 family metallopeptidase [Blastococcus haudaquaticus]SOD97895.1 Astacin (Peptidase family M12A) [Blastococcus haudaquaticus]